LTLLLHDDNNKYIIISLASTSCQVWHAL